MNGRQSMFALRRVTMVALVAVVGCSDDTPAMMMAMVPEAPAVPLVFPDEPFRATRPAAGTAQAYQPPVPETFALDNGLQVILVERRAVPYVSWHVTFPVGSMADPPGKEGLASLCLNVAYQASHRLLRRDREVLLANTGSEVGLGVGAHDVGFYGAALRPHVAAVAELWADIFLDPALQPSDFEGTVAARVNYLMVPPSQTPDAVASRVSALLAFGRSHPFNQRITAASLRRITLEDCRAFVTTMARPMGAKLFVAGAISRDEVIAAFATLLRMNGPAPMPLPTPPPSREPGQLFFVHAPGAPQSIVTLRADGPARTAPEYFAAELMAGILGGDSISSRLGANLREKNGYVYSFRGSFAYTLAGGGYFFSASARADSTAATLGEVLSELRRMRNEGVTTDELEVERRGRVAGLPYQFETAEQTLAQYGALDRFGIGFDAFARYAETLDAVSPALVQQAAAKYFAPPTFQILIVGDGPTVLPKLRELAASEPDLAGMTLTSLDSDGNPVTSP